MEKIKQYYDYYKSTPSDINEHLVTLYEYSKECSHITEMGVRACVSSWAFLYSKPKKMVSYDLIRHPNINTLCEVASENLIDFKFINNDVLSVDIEDTELLFIDTWHTYNQLSSELIKHSEKVKKYIILHDTTTYGYVDEDRYGGLSPLLNDLPETKKGLMNAVNDFIKSEKGLSWVVHEVFTNNNGLLILKNINYDEN